MWYCSVGQLVGKRWVGSMSVQVLGVDGKIKSLSSTALERVTLAKFTWLLAWPVSALSIHSSNQMPLTLFTSVIRVSIPVSAM